MVWRSTPHTRAKDEKVRWPARASRSSRASCRVADPGATAILHFWRMVAVSGCAACLQRPRYAPNVPSMGHAHRGGIEYLPHIMASSALLAIVSRSTVCSRRCVRIDRRRAHPCPTFFSEASRRHAQRSDTAPTREDNARVKSCGTACFLGSEDVGEDGACAGNVAGIEQVHGTFEHVAGAIEDVAIMPRGVTQSTVSSTRRIVDAPAVPTIGGPFDFVAARCTHKHGSCHVSAYRCQDERNLRHRMGSRSCLLAGRGVCWGAGVRQPGRSTSPEPAGARACGAPRTGGP